MSWRTEVVLSLQTTGAVVIGRNEGARLVACLESVRAAGVPAVYVDSGSSDGSVAAARALGVEVVELDLSTPFTAARARNAGFERLRDLHPDLAYVQFIDGDCEMAPGWFGRAAAELDARPEVAVVFGRVRERNPQATAYNRLCDMEWNRPVGLSMSCGGIAMVRAGAFDAAGRYDPALIAGEEPEMCVRLRQRDWKIDRIDAEMCLHDAAMTRFGQWWRRNVRGGHAFAEVSSMHRGSPQRLWVRESRSIWIWGVALPALGLALLWPVWWASAAVAALYPLQTARIFLRKRKGGVPARDAALYAGSVMLGKFAQAVGQLKFWSRALRGRPGTIIEYKGPSDAVPNLAAADHDALPAHG
jgi:glycosyltransferase involved in cell wall biosynthesis